jgi:hypothetical protein
MRATRDDATLSNSELTGVMFCPIGVVQASLTTRKVRFARNADAHTPHSTLQTARLLAVITTIHQNDATHEGRPFIDKGGTLAAPEICNDVSTILGVQN